MPFPVRFSLSLLTINDSSATQRHVTVSAMAVIPSL